MRSQSHIDLIFICLDIDECEQSPCSDGKCVNTIGSYKCVCPDGMELMRDGVSCEGMITSLFFYFV